jgi:hypothetical protein
MAVPITMRVWWLLPIKLRMMMMLGLHCSSNNVLPVVSSFSISFHTGIVVPNTPSVDRWASNDEVTTIDESFASSPFLSRQSSKKRALTTTTFSFEEMSKLDQRLALLEQEAPEFLFDYYEPHLYSFSIAPGQTSTLSVTSTAYALRALLEYPPDQRPMLLPIKDMIQALIDSEWRDNDLYDVSLLTLVILRMDPDLSIVSSLDQSTIEKFVRLVKLVLTGRPHRRLGIQQQFSSYISYLCCSVYVTLQSATKRNSQTGQLQLGMLPSDIFEIIGNDNESSSSISSFWMNLTVAVSRSAEISFNELCRQLAYRTAGDYSGAFDIIKLVYSLLSYVKATESLRGTAGTQLTPGQGFEREYETEEVIKINPRLVRTALRVFFEEQDPTTGLWDRGQPIYKSFRRQGRNVGNAYVFGIDALGSLLDFLPPEDFRPYLSHLSRSLDWLESNQDVQIIADYCDPETGQCFGKALRGWTSPFLSPPAGPKAWATAQSVTCLARMRLIVRQLLHNDVLEEFQGKKTEAPDSKAWSRLLDSDVGTPGSSTCRTIKSILEERVIRPFSDSVSAPSVGAAYSTILFGSPGTAKTTVCISLNLFRLIALTSLGWLLLLLRVVFVTHQPVDHGGRRRIAWMGLCCHRY